MLGNLGHYCDAVNNGQQALDALAMQPCDLVMLDIKMPELDGYEVTRR